MRLLCFTAMLFLTCGLMHAQVSFLPYRAIPLAAGDANLVCIGDLNNDGLNDVAVKTQTNLLVYLQDSAGNLISPRSYIQPDSYGIDIADVNNDGLKDIIM